jgi:hypothetical protein
MRTERYEGLSISHAVRACLVVKNSGVDVAEAVPDLGNTLDDEYACDGRTAAGRKLWRMRVQTFALFPKGDGV